MKTPSDRKALVLLVKDSDVLKKMIATWPNVHYAMTGSVDDDEPVASLALPMKWKLAWAAITGIGLYDVSGAEQVLFGNGICRPDGTVDPEVDAYLNREVDRMLGKKRTHNQEEAVGNEP